MCALGGLILLVTTLLAGVDGQAQAARPRRKRVQVQAHHHAPVPAAAPVGFRARRLMILGFGGRGAQAIRGGAIDALRKIASLDLVPLRPLEALRLGTHYGRDKSVTLAQRLNLTAVLYGEVTQAKRSFQVNLLLANGEDGKTVGEVTFEGRSLAAVRVKMRAQLWSNLKPLIDQSASPGPAEPSGEAAPEAAAPTETTPSVRAHKPTETSVRKPAPHEPTQIATTTKAPKPRKPEGQKEGEGHGDGEERQGEGESEAKPQASDETEAPPRRPVASPSSPSSPSSSSATATASERSPCALAELDPGGGAMVRRFNYRDEQQGALRGYALYRAPVGRVEGTLYPFATGACGFPAGLGVRLAYERMAPVTSQLADRKLGTTASAYQAELVLRVARGPLTLQPAIGYFVRQYSVDAGVVPAADYRALGVNLDAGLRHGPVSVELGAGARRLLGTGDLGSAAWFPGLSAFALSGQARLGYAVTSWIDVMATGAVEYYSFDFKIVAGGPYPNGIAASAYDVYLRGLLSVRLRFEPSARASGTGR